MISQNALVGIRGDGGTSQHQSGDEGAEEGFAATAGVVHELEESEVVRQPEVYRERRFG
jgi:hypothetical protein